MAATEIAEYVIEDRDKSKLNQIYTIPVYVTSGIKYKPHNTNPAKSKRIFGMLYNYVDHKYIIQTLSSTFIPILVLDADFTKYRDKLNFRAELPINVDVLKLNQKLNRKFPQRIYTTGTTILPTTCVIHKPGSSHNKYGDKPLLVEVERYSEGITIRKQ